VRLALSVAEGRLDAATSTSDAISVFFWSAAVRFADSGAAGTRRRFTIVLADFLPICAFYAQTSFRFKSSATWGCLSSSATEITA
jgi:hypothetical protein